MAIISANNASVKGLFGNTQFRYGMIYVIITFFVLLFLNIYTFNTTHKLFYQSKETSMIEKCQLTANEIGSVEVLNKAKVSEVISRMEGLKVTRLIVTNQDGISLYDSAPASPTTGSYTLFPEIIKAMTINVDAPYGYDTFTWHYQQGAMQSRAATPVLYYGTVIGCVYMMEYDTTQGALIQSLLNNVFYITFILELLIILFTLIYSHTFSKRFRYIIHSISVIREGDYTHQVNMKGNDEFGLLAAEFNDLTKRLQQSENKQRQFISDASHELKTPLASIKLLSDSIMQNEMDQETIREFVADIGNEAERLNRMSQKLLSLSRIETKPDSEYEIIQMMPTITRVVKMLSGHATQNNIDISIQVRSDSPILMLEDDLYQIVFNLAENGIKYNKPNGKLTIALESIDDNSVLKITDTGVGIPEDSLAQVFERFYRVDKARSRKTGGSGLGLSIVKDLVEHNQGSITVSSTPQIGTEFTVVFPVFDIGEDPV